MASSDERSYRHYMNRHLFSRVNLNEGNTHVPNGLAEDLDAECEAYEAAILAAGGIDLQLLGLGSNGHIGFNEPSGFSRVRVQRWRPTPASRTGMFGGDPALPTAITMGVGTILDSRGTAGGDGRAQGRILARSLEARGGRHHRTAAVPPPLPRHHG